MPFSFPPPDELPNYGIGSQLTISWNETDSSWSNATLVLMKNDDNYTCGLLNFGKAYCFPIQTAFNASKTLSLPWRVTTYDYPEYPEDRNPSYYLIMARMEGNLALENFASDSFYLYAAGDVPTTTYAAGTSSSTTSSLIPATSSTSSPSTTSSSPSVTSTEASSSKELDGADKTAIGVGIGLGVPLAIALVAFGVLFWRRQRRRKTAQASPAGPPAYKDNGRSKGTDGVGQNSSEGMQTRSELGSTPVLRDQVQSWQTGQHQQQSYLSELSADNSSTR